MELETVLYEFDGCVATVTMNRPDALNALSLQLTRDLDAAFRQAISDGARATVFTGSGRAFCSGGDLREMRTMWEREGRIEAFLEEPLGALHDVIKLIRETPVPFIAAVNGAAVGSCALPAGAWTDCRISVPATDVRNGLNALVLTSDTIAPGRPGDPRELAFVMQPSRVRLE